MSVIRLLFCGVACAAAALLVPAARAGVYEFNFNTDPQGWTSPAGSWEWSAQASNEKSWKLFVTGSNPSANYLKSPCFTIDAATAGFDFNEHRFKLGFSGTSGTFPYVPPAGQVQYLINGGAWTGVPLANWSSQGSDVLPTLDPAAFSSGTTDLLTNGFAFQGTSLDYAAVLAGCSWRFKRRRRGAGGRRIGTIGPLLATLLLAAGPAGAVPVGAVPVATYDFSIDGQGWTSQTFTYFSPSAPVAGTTVNRWVYAAAADVWEVDPKAVFSPAAWIVNTLTSPVLTVPATGVDGFEFVIRHRFNFPANIKTGNPVVAGQVAYRFYDPASPNAPFQPFLPATFAIGGVPPPYQSFSPWPNWVPNNFTVGTFGVPPLLATGGAWQGASPGWDSGQFVLSQVTLDGGLTAGQQVQFRFLNANLGVECTGGGWDVSRVEVVGILPEPGSLALAASAGGGLCVAGLARRCRRHQRASSPSVSPLTNALPPVSVV
jgi:hypothetical protein